MDATEPTTRPALRVASMEPGMAAALAEFHDGLSARTIRNRFFSAHPHLSPEELARFTNVDHHDRDALVLLDGSQIVGVARLDRDAPDASVAEIAFVIADEWQHRGLGTELMAVLVERARELGIVRLTADTLATNRAMRAVFAHAGLPVTTTFDDGVVHVTIDVAM